MVLATNYGCCNAGCQLWVYNHLLLGDGQPPWWGKVVSLRFLVVLSFQNLELRIWISGGFGVIHGGSIRLWCQDWAIFVIDLLGCMELPAGGEGPCTVGLQLEIYW